MATIGYDRITGSTIPIFVESYGVECPFVDVLSGI
jgi:hypothetical protein